MITELNERSQAIMRHIVDSFLETGEPTGSRSISRDLHMDLSPATIRNVMADLEEEGLLYAPHVSAGRLPTQQGLRLYIDGLMEVGDLSQDERSHIEVQCNAAGHSVNNMLEQATSLLSGLSSAAGLVVAPKTDKPVKQIQFVQLEPRRILVVLVMEDGLVENRILETEADIPASALVQAGNYLNSRLAGLTLQDVQTIVTQEIAAKQTILDALTNDLVERGLALAPPSGNSGHMIVRGQSRLLDDVKAIEDIEKARQLMVFLEEQETMARLLDAARDANGVQIFIGTENKIFDHSGWSMVISPYKNGTGTIVGAIGVIGPTRINYSRVIPLLDYTSKVMERLLGS